VTQAVLVFSAANPDFQAFLLDKSLVAVTHAGLSNVIVVSKADQVSPTQLEELIHPYVTAGYVVIPTSICDGTGISLLHEHLQGTTSVFVGPSGVGKSSLGNALSPGLGLKMGEISEKMGRGKHTTRHTELFMISPNTFVADAAGFSQLQVGVPSSELRLYFPEFQPLAEDCPYRGCLHIDEADCAVKQAVMEQRMSVGRYQSYRQLYAEVHHREETRY
jgi:ribosome biogenesis GTPase / thiamine phosphate phosphatase